MAPIVYCSCTNCECRATVLVSQPAVAGGAAPGQQGVAVSEDGGKREGGAAVYTSDLMEQGNRSERCGEQLTTPAIRQQAQLEDSLQNIVILAGGAIILLGE